MCEKDYGHVPVLLHECLDALAIKPDGIYVDGTLGRAGHSLEIVKRLTTGRLIGIDRDETAITAAKERLADYLDRVTLVHSNFSRLGEVLGELGIPGADGQIVPYSLLRWGQDIYKGFTGMNEIMVLSMLIGGLYGTQTVADSISTYDITMLTSIAVYLIPTAFLLRKKKLSEVELYFGRDMK